LIQMRFTNRLSYQAFFALIRAFYHLSEYILVLKIDKNKYQNRY